MARRTLLHGGCFTNRTWYSPCCTLGAADAAENTTFVTFVDESLPPLDGAADPYALDSLRERWALLTSASGVEGASATASPADTSAPTVRRTWLWVCVCVAHESCGGALCKHVAVGAAR